MKGGKKQREKVMDASGRVHQAMEYTHVYLLSYCEGTKRLINSLFCSYSQCHSSVKKEEKGKARGNYLRNDYHYYILLLAILARFLYETPCFL